MMHQVFYKRVFTSICASAPQRSLSTILPPLLWPEMDKRDQGIYDNASVLLQMDSLTSAQRLKKRLSLDRKSSVVNTEAHKLALDELMSKNIGAYCFRSLTLNPKAPENAKQGEEERIRKLIFQLNVAGNLKLVFASDESLPILARATMDDDSGKESIPLTSYSIAHINYMSDGQLPHFVMGLAHLQTIRNNLESGIMKSVNIGILPSSSIHNELLKELNIFLEPHLDKVNIQVLREMPETSIDEYDITLFSPSTYAPKRLELLLDNSREKGVAVTSNYLMYLFLTDRPLLMRLLKPWSADQYIGLDSLEDVKLSYRSLS